MPKTVVVIPTYNEAENLQKISQDLLNLPIPGMEVLIVDDNSPDGTGRIADELARKDPERFHILHRTGKLGLGTAYLQGFAQALEMGAENIIQMDADFSHSPEYVTTLLKKISEYDVVVGSRYVTGGRLDDRWGWSRWFLSWWANSVWVRLILGTRTRDATAGFKCWRAGALRSVMNRGIHSNGYVFQVEMCYVAEQIGLRILEIPIYFEDRRIGRSKMSIPVKLEAALRVFEIRQRHYREHSKVN